MKLTYLFVAHPDDDHISWLKVPHHGTALSVGAMHSPLQIYFEETVISSVTPPRSAEFLLLCLLPRKNREYMMGCLEEEFQTLLLPKYGRFYANVYYWWQVLQSLASIAWELLKKKASFAALWRLLR
jgi:hypothetical protein